MRADFNSLASSKPYSSEDTVAASLSHAATSLDTSTDSPRLDAELLLAHVLGWSRADLYAHSEHLIEPQQLAAYQALLKRRALGEPLAYLTSHTEFFGLDFLVDHRVLVPRPETETLVELALMLLPCSEPSPCICGSTNRDTLRPTIVDVGTGCGCIAVALAVHAPHINLCATDLSPDALDVARTNAERYNVAERITFLQSDLLTALSEPVDMIVANPPYVTLEEWSTLPREVREQEPHLALYGGHDGLDIIRRLLSQASTYLRPKGTVLVEIGATQGAAVTHLARQTYPDARITVRPDLSGRDRVLCIESKHDSDECS